MLISFFDHFCPRGDPAMNLTFRPITIGANGTWVRCEF